MAHAHAHTHTHHMEESFVRLPALFRMGPKWQHEIKTVWRAHTHTHLISFDADLIPGGNVQINIYAAAMTTASSSWSPWSSLTIIECWNTSINHNKSPSTSIKLQLEAIARTQHDSTWPVPGTSATTKDMVTTWPPSPSRSRLQYRPSPATWIKLVTPWGIRPWNGQKSSGFFT